MGQVTICDIMLPVGWPWDPLTKSWKFLVMKKCTLASKNDLIWSKFLSWKSNWDRHNQVSWASFRISERLFNFSAYWWPCFLLDAYMRAYSQPVYTTYNLHTRYTPHIYYMHNIHHIYNWYTLHTQDIPHIQYAPHLHLIHRIHHIYT